MAIQMKRARMPSPNQPAVDAISMHTTSLTLRMPPPSLLKCAPWPRGQRAQGVDTTRGALLSENLGLLGLELRLGQRPGVLQRSQLGELLDGVRCSRRWCRRAGA
jgi:hypothetical protein